MRTLVEDVMVTNVPAVSVHTSARTLAALLSDRHVSSVPVVDADNRVVGIVSEADVLRHRSTGQCAGEIMSSPAITVQPAEPVDAAVRLIDRYGVKRLPVVDDLGCLVGIVSRGDLVRLLARGEDLQAFQT